MKSKTIKKLYTLHGWVGVITGILLFVIAFTGAVSVFGRVELKLWANPEIRQSIPINTIKIEQLVHEYAEHVPEHHKEEVLIFLPGNIRGSKKLSILFESHHGEPLLEANKDEETHHNPPVGTIFQFDPYNFTLVHTQSGLIEEIFVANETDMADFIVNFHADLHLGRPVGLLITGVLGLTMMLSIITGIFIHRKILGNIFTFRPRKSYSLTLSDGHKVIGVWGLLFNSVIAFTGAFLGLVIVVLVPAAAFVSFGGDQAKLIEAFTAVPEPIIQNVAQNTHIAKAFDDVLQIHDDANVNFMTIKAYGDSSAMMYASFTGGENVSEQAAVYYGSGDRKEVYSNFARIEGYSGVILDMMAPLHFGNFGGVFVKFIWAILGLGTALLPLTGLMLWMERSTNAINPKYSQRTYQRFNRLIVGGCGGVVIATLILFPAQMFLKYTVGVKSVGSVIGWPFFATWLCMIAWAFFAKDEKKIAKCMLYSISILLIFVLPIDMLVSGENLWFNMLDGHYSSIAIDIICLLIGVYCLRLLQQSRGNENNPNNENIHVKEAVNYIAEEVR